MQAVSSLTSIKAHTYQVHITDQTQAKTTERVRERQREEKEEEGSQ